MHFIPSFGELFELDTYIAAQYPLIHSVEYVQLNIIYTQIKIYYVFTKRLKKVFGVDNIKQSLPSIS